MLQRIPVWFTRQRRRPITVISSKKCWLIAETQVSGARHRWRTSSITFWCDSAARCQQLCRAGSRPRPTPASLSTCKVQLGKHNIWSSFMRNGESVVNASSSRSLPHGKGSWRRNNFCLFQKSMDQLPSRKYLSTGNRDLKSERSVGAPKGRSLALLCFTTLFGLLSIVAAIFTPCYLYQLIGGTFGWLSGFSRSRSH